MHCKPCNGHPELYITACKPAHVTIWRGEKYNVYPVTTPRSAVWLVFYSGIWEFRAPPSCSGPQPCCGCCGVPPLCGCGWPPLLLLLLPYPPPPRRLPKLVAVVPRLAAASVVRPCHTAAAVSTLAADAAALLPVPRAPVVAR